MKRMLISIANIIIILTLANLFVNCTKNDTKEIQVGAILPLTGNQASYGQTLKKGMDLALIQINANGGINGDRFEDRRRIVPMRRIIDGRIEPIPFRPEDFERGGILADTIKKTGIIVK